jgi:hypothetical protein
MELADPQRSYAVLIGSSAFASDALEDLPAVSNNLTRLGELLRDPDVWGLPERQCAVLPQPDSREAILDAVHTAAGQAADTLLVYYAGHGLTHPDVNGLLLALAGTDPNGHTPHWTSTPYEARYWARGVTSTASSSWTAAMAAGPSRAAWRG